MRNLLCYLLLASVVYAEIGTPRRRLLSSGGGTSPVSVDATMTTGNCSTDCTPTGHAQEASSSASITSTGMTVGTGATMLLATLSMYNGSGNSITSIACTWDNAGTPQTMTLQANNQTAQSKISAIFSLANPHTGNLSLYCAVQPTNALSSIYLSAISLKHAGIAQSDNVSVASATSLAVPTSSDGASVAVFSGTSDKPTMTGTALFGDGHLNGGGGASYILGGSTSNTHSFTGQGNGSISGVHLVAQ